MVNVSTVSKHSVINYLLFVIRAFGFPFSAFSFFSVSAFLFPTSQHPRDVGASFYVLNFSMRLIQQQPGRNSAVIDRRYRASMLQPPRAVDLIGLRRTLKNQ